MGKKKWLSITVAPPCLVDLSKLIDTETVSKRNTFMWEIGIQRNNDVSWSVVLAWLYNNTSNKPASAMGAIMQSLRKKSFQDKSLKKLLKKFNPFLNRHSCFYNDSFQCIVETFNAKVGRSQNRQNMFEAAADFLECRICVINKSNWTETVYGNTYADEINLFFNCNKFKVRHYTFGLQEETGYRWQKFALATILRNIPLPDRLKHVIIEKIGAHPDTRDNFLKHVIHCRQIQLLSFISKSPYLLRKLRDAGFEMDPLAEGLDGQSAMYHSLVRGKWDMIYIMYEIAMRFSLMQSGKESDLRSSSSQSSRRHIADGLTQTIDKLKQANDLDEKQRNSSCMRGQEIQQLNDFHIETYEKVNKDYMVGSKVFQAEIRKDNIIAIIESYDKYFHWMIPSEDQPVSEMSMYFEQYFNHSNYFGSVDFSAALFFFDNLFLLKERVILPNEKQYTEIERKFFLLIFCIDRLSTLKISEEKVMNIYCRIIPVILERRSLHNQLMIFKEHLQQTELTSDNTVECIPESLVKTLTDLPEMHDQFIIARLCRYMEAATTVKVENPKSVLILARALQVLGESFKFNSEDSTCIEYIISCIIPQDLIRNLKEIRDNFSNFTEINIIIRKDIELDYSLFANIQHEIKQINYVLSPVFSFQKFRMKKYILHTIRKGIQQALEEKMDLSDIFKRIGIPEKPNFKYALKHFYKDLQKHLTDDLRSNASENFDIIYKYRQVLKSMFANVSSELNATLGNFDTKMLKKELNTIFYPLESFLKFIASENTISSNRRRTLIKKIQSRLYTRHEVSGDEMIITSKNILSSYQEIIEAIFKETKVLCSMSDESCESYKSIKILKKKLNNMNCLSNQEKLFVKENLHPKFYVEHKALKKLLMILENKYSPLPRTVADYTQYLISSQDLADQILQSCERGDRANALEYVRSTQDHYKNLENALENDELDKKLYNDLCVKLEMCEQSKAILGKIVIGQQRTYVRGERDPQKLEFLRGRIEALKCIAIDENIDIKLLYERAKSDRTRQHINERLVQLYLRDKELQASVEMLLFDCMNILKRNDLKHLWIKVSKLYNGINLRNVLAHGNPLLEMLGKILDPEDFPSEIVKYILSLIADLGTLNDMVELRKLTNLSSFDGIISDENSEHAELCRKIRSNENWVKYKDLVVDLGTLKRKETRAK